MSIDLDTHESQTWVQCAHTEAVSCVSSITWSAQHGQILHYAMLACIRFLLVIVAHPQPFAITDGSFTTLLPAAVCLYTIFSEVRSMLVATNY